MNRTARPRPISRRKRVLAWIGASAALLLLAGIAVGGVLLWRASDLLVKPVDTQPLGTTVVEATADTVTLPAEAAATSPGVFGLDWECGDDICHGMVGEILELSDEQVTRVLDASSVPPTGAKAKVSVTVYDEDPKAALNLDFEEVRYSSECGPMPAWFVPSTGSVWVIQVHGLGAGRAAGLRSMPALNGAGHPVLDITYRNDPGAPGDENGGRQLGVAEWRDLEAAVQYALDNGASGVVLFGFSMGGAVVEQYLNRAEDTTAVRGVILDSPALDFDAALDHVVAGLGLPGWIAPIERAIVESRSGVAFADADSLAQNLANGGPRQPVLIFHGTRDSIIPLASSEEFAQAWPEEVELVVVDDAIHTGAWNTDRDRYETHMLAFLARL